MKMTSLPQLAREYGVSPWTIRRCVRMGVIKAVKSSDERQGRYFVDRASFENWLLSRTIKGR